MEPLVQYNVILIVDVDDKDRMLVTMGTYEAEFDARLVMDGWRAIYPDREYVLGKTTFEVLDEE